MKGKNFSRQYREIERNYLNYPPEHSYKIKLHLSFSNVDGILVTVTVRLISPFQRQVSLKVNLKGLNIKGGVFRSTM